MAHGDSDQLQMSETELVSFVGVRMAQSGSTSSTDVNMYLLMSIAQAHM